ncbi:MAG: copper homeostasis protein CutC [Phycisphaeraceae bacterium]
MTIALEVCVASLRDAAVSASAGAARVELNSALELGGLTPSPALVELVVETAQSLRCEVIAMLRPRPGGFDYDEHDLRVMQRNIALLLQLGVDGVAFGVLHRGGTIHAQACRELIAPVHNAGRQAVFHRAFDLTPDPFVAIDTLIQLGFQRVLTSGQQPTAPEGAGLIGELIQHADRRIEVLPGSGIRPDNVTQLVKQTGCTQVHASLSTEIPDGSGSANPVLRFDATPARGMNYRATDGRQVEAMVAALKGI